MLEGTYLRVIHSLKTAFAVALGYLLAIFFNIPEYEWILITIIVVMCAQTTVGSFVKKSYARVIGTILGAVAGISILALWPHQRVMIGVELVVCTVPFTFLAFRKDDLSYSGVLGIITVMIVVLTEPATIIDGLFRIMNVMLGIIISVLVTFLVLPSYARNLFFKNMRPLVNDFAHFFQQSLLEGKNRKTNTALQNLDDKIEAQLLSQKKLLADSNAEWPKKSNLLKRHKEILFSCLRIHRHLNFMEYYFHSNHRVQQTLKNEPTFQTYCQQTMASFSCVEQQVRGEKNRTLPSTSIFIDGDELKKELNIHKISENSHELKIIYAFLLSSQRLRVHIENLSRLLESCTK